jgi:hypothetical protein
MQLLQRQMLLSTQHGKIQWKHIMRCDKSALRPGGREFGLHLRKHLAQPALRCLNKKSKVRLLQQQG